MKDYIRDIWNHLREHWWFYGAIVLWIVCFLVFKESGLFR